MSRATKEGINCDSMNRSLTNAMDFHVGIDAVYNVINAVFDTRIGQLPYTPREGFNLRDLLWRANTSELRSIIENDLKDKISRQCKTENVNVNIVKNGTINDIMIDFTDMYGNSVANFTFELGNDGEGKITVKAKQTNKLNVK